MPQSSRGVLTIENYSAFNPIVPTKLTGNFTGTPTLFTENNSANKVQVGSKGYEWIAKINDVNIPATDISINDFLTAFGVTKTNKGNTIDGSALTFCSYFTSRLSTTDGINGGNMQSWTMNDIDMIKDLPFAYCVIYDIDTDSVQVCEPDVFDEQYGNVTITCEIGYNTLINFLTEK